MTGISAATRAGCVLDGAPAARYLSASRTSGGIGRRTGFRFRRRKAWGFKSLLVHSTSAATAVVLDPAVEFSADVRVGELPAKPACLHSFEGAIWLRESESQLPQPRVFDRVEVVAGARR